MTPPAPAAGRRPSARSIANSRVRWATVIEKALKMMKAPTKTATPPKASSAGVQEGVDRLARLGGRVGRGLLAGLDDDVGGQRGAEAACQLLGGDAGLRLDVDRRQPPLEAVPALHVLERS
jgi:hypothetical protein